MRQEKQEFLKKMKKEISEIKKEGKIEDIKIEPVKEKKSKKYSLKKGALIGATALALATTNVPIRTTNDGSKILIEAEAAKKDKKKPVLKFKGKTKMVVQENESIKIPKTTAKDNKDGNVTKKIKVTVKKGKKNYAGLAKKIKNNKPVTFTDAGKYVITYTVSDKAGNKATKKRYITVTEGLTTTETVTTEAPVTRRAPARVQQMQTTEAPTTSAPATTEAPTTEAPSTKIPTDYSKYKIEKININNYEYNVTRDINFSQEVLSKSNNSDCINLNIENKYTRMVVDAREGLLENYGYLKYLGKITATDKNGTDISDRIVVRDSFYYPLKDNEYSYDALVCIYVEDNFGNSYAYELRIFNIDDVDDYSDDPGYEKIEDGKVKLYVTKNNSMEMKSQSAKVKKYKLQG